MRLRTAATDGERIFMDMAFCSKLSADERLFVMAHEVWHCVLMHMLRCQTRDPSVFNVAADMEVNRMLKKEGLKSPEWCLMPKCEWDELSAEEIYEHIRKRPKPPQISQSQKGADVQADDGIGSNKQFDKHIYPNQSDEAPASAGDNTPTITD